eukprot:CAMPEP_0206465580 /NCGR_PEP_ID=MMETSP0324_2-20121206/27922_1 /ASSEMBLY_ACC=CAM_ASM_000836 /TAXON_ID=2866 /ORGANISM="Crypthecodinium cohnii, Strain Seligo" /LENGTH=345 /DNA_ID=CAMNT_0053938481 /DNA_START=69 /DNA_END=1103 /DNA_ORIENTATION=+
MADLHDMSNDELIAKVNRLQVALSELSLNELEARRSEMTAREQALERRSAELDAREAILEQRELEVQYMPRPTTNAAPAKGNTSPRHQALMTTPTPARNYISASNRPMPQAPTLPLSAQASSAVSPRNQEFGKGRVRSPQAVSPAQSAASCANSSYMVQSPIRRRLSSGPGCGSASKLKAMFEQKAAATASTPAVVRGARRTAPPLTATPTATPVPSQTLTPAPKVSLQELLKADEAASTKAVRSDGVFTNSLEGEADIVQEVVPVPITSGSDVGERRLSASSLFPAASAAAAATAPPTKLKTPTMMTMSSGSSAAAPARGSSLNAPAGPAPKVTLQELLRKDEE